MTASTKDGVPTIVFTIAGPIVPSAGEDPPGIALPTKMAKGELYWLYIVCSELHVQATYSLVTFQRLVDEAEKESGTVFPSIHSMLTAAANVSKLFRPELMPGSKAVKTATPIMKRRVEMLRESFGNLASLPILSAAVDRRNDLDHLDDRLDQRVHLAMKNRKVTLGIDHVITTHDFVSDGKEPPPIRLFNRANRVFNVLGKEIDLKSLARELDRIRAAAETVIRMTKHAMAANARDARKRSQ